MYIDSSTGVDRLDSFRVGDQRPRQPLDYQQIASNSSSGYNQYSGHSSHQYQSTSDVQWKPQFGTDTHTQAYSGSTSAQH